MAVDRVWMINQMSQAQLPQVIRTSLERLTDVWNSMNFPDRIMQEETLRLFVSLVNGHAIVPDDPTFSWYSSSVVRPRVNDVVRVRADAYDSSGQEFHLNGRTGTVIRITHGMYVVSLEGDGGVVHFRPESLETRREVRG